MHAGLGLVNYVTNLDPYSPPPSPAPFRHRTRKSSSSGTRCSRGVLMCKTAFHSSLLCRDVSSIHLPEEVWS